MIIQRPYLNLWNLQVSDFELNVYFLKQILLFTWVVNESPLPSLSVCSFFFQAVPWAVWVNKAKSHCFMPFVIVLCYRCSQLPHVVFNLPPMVPHSRNPRIPLCLEALFQYFVLPLTCTKTVYIVLRVLVLFTPTSVLLMCSPDHDR